MASESKKTETKPEAEAAVPPAAPAEGAAAPAGAETAGAEAAAPKARKAKGKGGRLVPTGIVHIRATFNNTSVTITDPRGGVIAWSSAGRCAFKGSRKSTAYAATVVAQEAARAAIANAGMREVEICVQGPGSGRESAIRAIQAAGLNVTSIRDVTPVPHNGCRPPKRRRV
jgi:small subunit ribosomal protein S11